MSSLTGPTGRSSAKKAPARVAWLHNIPGEWPPTGCVSSCPDRIDLLGNVPSNVLDVNRGQGAWESHACFMLLAEASRSRTRSKSDIVLVCPAAGRLLLGWRFQHQATHPKARGFISKQFDRLRFPDHPQARHNCASLAEVASGTAVRANGV